MKEKVVFQTNVPVTAALAYSDGLKVEGSYGDQVMYSLTDERVRYVPPIVRNKLIDLGRREPRSEPTEDGYILSGVVAVDETLPIRSRVLHPRACSSLTNRSKLVMRSCRLISETPFNGIQFC